VNSLLLKKYSSQQVVLAALVCQVLTGIVFLTGALNGWFELPGIIAVLFAYLCCLGLTNPNTAALSLAPFEKNAGSASALMGALQMGIGALASVPISLFNTHTAVPMEATMASSALLGLLLLLAGRARILKAAVTV
jgi:DHA1 family bicyclomycin/chloramphenicol resistance-like MFS transporter